MFQSIVIHPDRMWAMIDKLRKVVRGEDGFTLVEMMVVLIIIAILVALGVWAYIGSVGVSKMIRANGDITTIQAALDAYYTQNQQYPNGAASAAFQNMLTSAGISSYVVNGGAPPAKVTPPYNMVFSLGSNTYRVYSIMPANGQVMEGIGTNGISTPASLTVFIST
jgi:general secretion pathway protein G